MNKLMVFPLIIGVLCMMFASFQALDGTGPLAGFNPNNQTVDGSEKDGPGVEEYEVNIWGTGGMLILLGAAIAIVVVAGITVLGTGLSGLSQSILFLSVFYLGIWAMLSVAILNYVSGIPLFGMFFYLCITILYTIGFASEVTGGDVSD